MPQSSAYIPTHSASRYLQQLCKHWSHKLEVEFTPTKGRVTFEPGRHADFEATETGLDLRIEAADDEILQRTQGTVINHLKRFAFREELGEVEWHRRG